MTSQTIFPRTIGVVTLVAATFCIVALGLFYYTKSQPPLMSEITGRDGAPMMLIPAGSFTMGTSHGETNEQPDHRIYLHGFYMDKYEVTTSRYAKFLEATGREKPFKWNDVNIHDDGDRPVVGVTWGDAQAYCQWCGKRLPTEAEWEKAARGTDGRTYPWGNEEPAQDRGNFDQGFHWRGYSTLAVVGSFERGKSPYGVYDLAGNVSEWTADWYDPNYYVNSPARNPPGPQITENADPFSLDFSRKAVRGASWTSGPSGMRSSYRDGSNPMNRHGDVGFRCAQNDPK